MLYKLYEKIKEIIKEYYKFFITFFVVLILCTIEFPYYIEAPGGIINIADKIEIKNSHKSKGSLNMAYVSEYKATIPLYLMSFVLIGMLAPVPLVPHQPKPFQSVYSIMN